MEHFRREGFDVARSQRGGGGDLRFSRRLRADYLWGGGEPDHAISGRGGCYHVDCDGIFAVFAIERGRTKSPESRRAAATTNAAAATKTTTTTTTKRRTATRTRAIWMGESASAAATAAGRWAIGHPKLFAKENGSLSFQKEKDKNR